MSENPANKQTSTKKARRSLFSAIEDGMNVAGAVFIFLIMMMGVAEVGGRYLFNRPMPFHIELVELSMPFLVFLTVAYTQRIRGHIVVDFFTSRLHGRKKRINTIICWSIILPFCVALTVGTGMYALHTYEIGDQTPQGSFPVWPSTAVITLGLLWLCMRIAIQLYEEIALLRKGQP